MLWRGGARGRPTDVGRINNRRVYRRRRRGRALNGNDRRRVGGGGRERLRLRVVVVTVDGRVAIPRAVITTRIRIKRMSFLISSKYKREGRGGRGREAEENRVISRE